MQLFNVGFVIWREVIEALLVIGVLNAWLGTRPADERRVGRAWLWSGVALGVVGAVVLAVSLLTLGDTLSDEAQEYFQTVVVLLAAVLIVQMVIWMRRRGRTLKRDIHSSLSQAADRAQWGGVFTLAALAVLREGSEAAIFLYGTMAGAATTLVPSLLAAALGLGAAAATYWALQAGSRYFSWRTFFRVTEVILLLLAGSLLLTGIDHLISLGIVPQMSRQMWDSSHILPDGGAFGSLVSAFTGYRARPVLVELLVFALYWIVVAWLLKRQTAPATR